MSDWREHLPTELDEVAQRLRADRPRPSELDLDRIKLSVRPESHRGIPVVGGLKTKLLAPVLTLGIMGGGSSAVVLAARGDGGAKSNGNGNDSNASKSTYCPPTKSHKPKTHCTHKPPPKSHKPPPKKGSHGSSKASSKGSHHHGS